MDLTELRDQLIEAFNLSELKKLCFDLDIRHESLPGETIDDKARELVAYCCRHGRLPQLVAKCRLLRANRSWPDPP